jgi:hypothetical protein
VKTINTPGFTAEASLFSFSAGFQALTEGSVSGGLVRPANFIPKPVWCSTKLECRPINSFPWIRCSNTGFGIWNPVTHRCE